MFEGTRIIDGHCHLASKRCVPREFAEGVASNISREANSRGVSMETDKIAQMLVSQNEDHDGDMLIAKMNEAAIEKTVLLAPDFTYAFDSQYCFKDVAQQHAAVRRRHPGRFYVFLGIDPRWGNEGYDFFEQAVTEYGFEGLKVYPPCGFSPSDTRMFPLYEICAARNMPVLLHTGPTTPTLSFKYADPCLIDDAAMQFPSVNFILAHGGVNFVERAKLMCYYRPNIYLDIAGFPVAMSPNGWRTHLRELFAQNINHKIIFGTDWPVFSMKEDLSAMITSVLAEDGPMARLGQAEVAAIMAGTIQSLLPAPEVSELAAASQREGRMGGAA